MTTTKGYITLAAIALICSSASGCVRTGLVRQTALRLRSQVIEDERLIDNNIAKQRQFYQDQTATIENTRTRNIPLNVEGFRRARSAHAATSMSLDPNQQARLSNLMDYLLETHDQEFELWTKLYGSDQQAREELKSKIGKLQRQKKLLEQVKDNLNNLALAPSSKKRAQALLKFSQDTYAAYQKVSK